MNLPEFLRASPPPVPPRHGALSYEETNLVEENLSRLNSEHPYDVEIARQVFASLGVKAVPRLSERMIDAEGKPHAQVLLTLMSIGAERIAVALPELSGREKVATLRDIGALGRFPGIVPEDFIGPVQMVDPLTATGRPPSLPNRAAPPARAAVVVLAVVEANQPRGATGGSIAATSMLAL